MTDQSDTLKGLLRAGKTVDNAVKQSFENIESEIKGIVATHGIKLMGDEWTPISSRDGQVKILVQSAMGIEFLNHLVEKLDPVNIKIDTPVVVNKNNELFLPPYFEITLDFKEGES
jgi:hypothetical protein